MFNDCLCMKNVRIWSFSCPFFQALGLNTERYSVSLHIQSECGKVQTRKSPNANTFHTVCFCMMLLTSRHCLFFSSSQFKQTNWKMFTIKKFLLCHEIFFWNKIVKNGSWIKCRLIYSFEKICSYENLQIVLSKHIWRKNLSDHLYLFQSKTSMLLTGIYLLKWLWSPVFNIQYLPCLVLGGFTSLKFSHEINTA